MVPSRAAPPGVIPGPRGAPAPTPTVIRPPAAPTPAPAPRRVVAVEPGIVAQVIIVEVIRTAHVHTGTGRPEAHDARGVRTVLVTVAETVGITLVVTTVVLHRVAAFAPVAFAASVVFVDVPSIVSTVFGPITFRKLFFIGNRSIRRTVHGDLLFLLYCLIL